MESTTGLPNPSKHGRNGKLSPFSPFPFHPSSTSFAGGSGGFPMEEQPLWLDDLLNDSETFPHRGHRRSASDSYACLGEAAVALSLDDEPGFVNAYFGSSQNLIPRSIMQAEGGGVSADLEFIEQQNMILTMENRALRQRLESISQEQMIKQCRNLYCLSSFTTTLLFFINKLMFKISAGEQGMLEREIGRLQSLYHLSNLCIFCFRP